MKAVCSPSRYAKTIKGLSKAHQDAIRKIGFGGMLHMKEITLRRTMLSKLVGRYNITWNFRNFHSVVLSFL
jgi:hypothetical protein